MSKLKLYKIIANAIDLLYHSGMSIKGIEDSEDLTDIKYDLMLKLWGNIKAPNEFNNNVEFSNYLLETLVKEVGN